MKSKQLPTLFLFSLKIETKLVIVYFCSTPFATHAYFDDVISGPQRWHDELKVQRRYELS
jgi:hypothetical protein